MVVKSIAKVVIKIELERSCRLKCKNGIIYISNVPAMDSMSKRELCKSGGVAVY